MFKRLFNRFCQRRDKRRLGRAVDKALTLHKRDGRRYYVFNLAGKLMVVSSADVKRWKRTRFIRAGVSLADLKNAALYKTPL